MKTLFCVLFFLISNLTFPNNRQDSVKNKLKANLSFSLNSNGISSIPSFTLDKPAAISSVSLSKGRFLYEPQLAYGLNFKPWYIDNWFHYKIVDRPHFEVRAGMNLSTFFSPDTMFREGNVVVDEKISKAQKYFDLELAFTYRFSSTTSLTALYWSDRGLEKGTIQGHFFNLIADKSDIKAGKNILFSANVQLFYLDYGGKNDGMFISPRLTSSSRNIPLSLFFQATQGIFSNISPFPEFKWNIGLSYAL